MRAPASDHSEPPKERSLFLSCFSGLICWLRMGSGEPPCPLSTLPLARRGFGFASVETNHEISALKEDDEGKNVGMGAALCGQSAPHTA
jgi:hypothetical protein